MTKRPENDAVDPVDSDFFRLVGERIRAIRKLGGENQTEVATLMGVDQSTWSKWETGKRIPNPARMARFVARAKASLDLIYRGVPANTHPALVRLLRAAHPELVEPEPTDRGPDTGTDLASYRSSIPQ